MHSYDTVHQLTCPSTSQQNGRVKRKLRHFLDTVRALLLSTKVPTPFWGEAALHDAHAINRIPSPVIQNQTPYERFFRSPPNYHHLHSFGFVCFVLLHPHEHNKLEPRLKICYFLGYNKTQKGYRYYDPVSHRLLISYNVVFWEHNSFVKPSHFSASLSSLSILDLFPNKAYIPSVAAPDSLVFAPDSPIFAPDSPIDFSVQPPYIFDPFPSSPFNEQVEDEQVEDELPNPELGSLVLTPPEDLARGIPPRHSTRVRSIPAHLLDYHCYIALTTLHESHTYREASIDPLW